MIRSVSVGIKNTGSEAFLTLDKADVYEVFRHAYENEKKQDQFHQGL